MVERNADLFFEIADMLESQPELYDQETFGSAEELAVGRASLADPTACGSRHCIAGWAAILSGQAEFGLIKRPHTTGFDAKFFSTKSGREVEPSIVGQRVLGLTDAEADVLFGGGWEPPCEDHDDYEYGPSALKVAEALRHIGKGEAISDHTEWDHAEDVDVLRLSERRRGIPQKGQHA